jgi:hypothetical protein
MRLAYWMIQATNTHSEYATLAVFPFQQWLHKRTSLLRYTDIASLMKYQKVYCLYESTVRNGHEYERVMSCETNFMAEVGY